MPPRTLADWEGILSTIEGTPFALLPAPGLDNDELPIRFERWVKHVVTSGQFRTVEAAAVLHVAIRDQAMRCRGLSLKYDTDAQIEFSEAGTQIDRMFHPKRSQPAKQPPQRSSVPPVKEIRGGGDRGSPGELKDYGPVTRDRYLVECTEGNATITVDALLCRDDALAMMRFGDELGISLDMRRVKFSLVDCNREGATCDGLITDQ